MRCSNGPNLTPPNGKNSMTSPGKDVEKIKALLEQGQKNIEEEQWQAAEEAAKEAIALDDMQPKSYDVMAKALEGQGKTEDAATWRDRAKLIRREAWQRQVEAEARGGHEVLGDPGRREIP